MILQTEIIIPRADVSLCACDYIEAEWRIYASVHLASIGSYNGLSVPFPVVIWTNAILLLVDPSEQISVKFNQNTIISIQTNEYESIVRKMASILYLLQCVKSCLFSV